jgi:PIF1 helicase.
MIIDEISMVDLAALSIINTHCKTARSLGRSSTDLFGGLPVVILMGDFHQFPPVQGQPLWKFPRNDTEQDGKLIWNQFDRVIILDEQMRQAEDVSYRDLLRRARSGTLTSDDLATLNSKAISSLSDPQFQTSPAIVKLNSLRHVINRLQIERFARAKRQKLFVFPALHTRTKSSGPTALRLRADDLLGFPEQGAKVPFPGLILYTASMPTMVLTNICTPVGLVNGATGRATGVVLDPESESLPKICNKFVLKQATYDQRNS